MNLVTRVLQLFGADTQAFPYSEQARLVQEAENPTVRAKTPILAVFALELVDLSGNPAGSTIVSLTADHTLVVGNAGKYLRINSGSATDLTVPSYANAAIPIGGELVVRVAGAGAVTLIPASGVTLNGDTLTFTQHQTFALKKVGANEWDVI